MTVRVGGEEVPNSAKMVTVEAAGWSAEASTFGGTTFDMLAFLAGVSATLEVELRDEYGNPVHVGSVTALQQLPELVVRVGAGGAGARRKLTEAREDQGIGREWGRGEVRGEMIDGDSAESGDAGAGGDDDEGDVGLEPSSSSQTSQKMTLSEMVFNSSGTVANFQA